MRRRLPLLFALALTLALPATAHGALRAERVDASRLGQDPDVHIRDRVITRGTRGSVARAARADDFGGTITADNGAKVRVFLSDRYRADPAVLQSWADAFAHFVHGGELRKLTVYVAPFDEIQRECGDQADSCYFPDDGQIDLLGDSALASAPLVEIAAHEYGHHIDANRNDDPWDASIRGPKYWGTNLGVCKRTRAGTAFPGNEGAHYADNPDEAFAETNRVLDGGTSAWDIVADSWIPTKADLHWARQDILHPFPGNEYEIRKGTVGHHKSRYLPITVDNDGVVDVTARGRGTLDPDLYLYTTKGKLLKRAATDGADHLRYTACGYRHLKVEVYGFKGHGRYRLKLDLPFDGDGVASSSR